MKRIKLSIFMSLIMLLTSCEENFSFKRHDEFINYENNEIILYQNSKDGAVKYFEYNKFDFFAYDSQSETIVYNANDKLFIHAYKNGELLYEIDLGRNDVSSIETYKGRAAICFDSDEQGLIRLVDLSKGECQDYHSPLQTSQAFLTDKYMYITESDQWCEVYKMDLSSSETTKFVNRRFYNCVIDFNRKENLIYISEGGNSGDLYYLNVEDSTVREIDYSSLYKEAYFDGRYLHNSGRLFHPSSGRQVSSDEIFETIENDNFKYEKTLYSNNLLTFIKGENNNTFIYSKENNYLVYGFKASITDVFEINKTKYLVRCEDSKHVAIVDISKIKR